MIQRRPSLLHVSLCGAALVLVLASCGGKPPVVPRAAEGKEPVQRRARADAAIARADVIAREHRELGRGETESLLARIAGPCPEGLDSGTWEHEVNSTLNALRAQPNPVAGLTTVLLGMAQDHPDKVLRLYAMQHLVSQHGRETPEFRRRIEELLMVMARDDSHAMSGEAVMLLGDLKLSDLAGDDLPDPGPRAMEIVADHGAPSDARISAIHACVARRQKSIVPELRLIAADPQCNIIERRAAIHAIGQLGETSDKKLLESMIPSNPLLVPAITPAIAKLSELD